MGRDPVQQELGALGAVTQPIISSAMEMCGAYVGAYHLMRQQDIS